MTKQDFIRYLFHPETLNGHSIGALEKLVREYPYFQIGRMLYLKNLHNESSIAYEKNLSITSAYAPSGKALYNLIKKKVGSKQLAVGNEIKETTNEVLPKSEPIAHLQEVPINNEKDSSVEFIPSEAEGPGMTQPKKDEYDELQLLEKEMLREAYRTSITIDILEEKQESRVESQERTSQKPEARSQNYSFNDWLKIVSGQTPASATEEKTVHKKQQSGLIDKFILEETAKSALKPKTEFYSAEAMAKKSIKDDETFVSETLASIYLKQGNLPKALRAYEILIVKYPEKIHIFAPLLEKIKKLLEDQKSR